MPKMKLYGLIGFPLTHSYSKILFDKMFAQHQIGDSSYKLFPLEDLSALDHLIVETPDLIGLNVTIPYKVKIISLLNQLSPEAQSIGAINCVFIQRNANRYFLSGHNTDASAFFSTLTEFNLQAVKRALIIGNGGAAKAVIYSLNKSGIEFKIAGRKGSKGVDYQLTLMDQIEFSNFDLIVNCTPVGMHPYIDETPLPSHLHLNENQIVYDLIYNPVESALLKSALMNKCKVFNGMRMLELQAEMAYQWWLENNISINK